MSALDSLPANVTLIRLMNRSSNPLVLQEGLDLALAMSAMGQEVVLLCDKPALALFRPYYRAPGVRDLRKNVNALSLYGIEQIFVHKAIFANAQTEDSNELPDRVEMLDNHQIRTLIARSQRTLSF